MHANAAGKPSLPWDRPSIAQQGQILAALSRVGILITKPIAESLEQPTSQSNSQYSQLKLEFQL
ncbi:hypothetical protein [Ensifer sp. M14]|jgi:hypothetical protein|uniref:hypothetical protein n=1 Tax=Ensifer sp. M14 TaxID=2203782 RepID=UPI0011C05E5D|nr:hypothetical protein [Ensifer sp. M14]